MLAALGLAGPMLAGGTSLPEMDPAKGQRSDRDAPARAPREGAPWDGAVDVGLRFPYHSRNRYFSVNQTPSPRKTTPVTSRR